MKYNEALSKLIEAGADAKISRSGGPTIRKAKTSDEKHQHVYVNDDGSKCDLTAEDLAADDWSVSGEKPKPKASPPPEPRPSSPAPPHDPKPPAAKDRDR